MIRQSTSKLFLALVVLLMVSTVNKTFAQTNSAVKAQHALFAGDPGGGDPDPTGTYPPPPPPPPSGGLM